MMTANRILIMAIVAFIACAAALGGTHCIAQQMQQPVTQAKVSMSDIDSALARGPVFIEFETASCHYCQQQKPVSQGLARDYAGKITFFFVDAMENHDLARTFQVNGVPQMDIVVSKSDSKYTYIDQNGGTSDSITASRFVGYTEKDRLKPALDAALQKRT
ncbi:MAG TPA: thioredoxin family protein [Methanocella sp.]|uniref:thioredoxin family protein n=1 Tax=Methanocella sp. TaxID=2052833 RepID=UPI002C59C93E|nr:thioredoxin family protein [Methanocella sp.]HTY91087.1 thioredoxin family protein [Methanocella sp.]